MQLVSDKFRKWFANLFKEEHVDQTSKRCSLSLNSKEISLMEVDKEYDDTIKILLSEIIQYAQPEDIGIGISHEVKKNNLYRIPTYWLLDPEDYQLFLIESMPVTKEEFRQALNWRVRSLISYPLEEAVVDSFTIPAKKATPDSPMIAAIVANTNQLNKKLNIFKKSGLAITTIDIPELAMRNLTSFYENDAKSTAFVYFFEQTAILNITLQKTLYFTRRLNWKPNAKNITNKDYEQVSLDMLRYFDYFQSQWRHPSPQRVFVASEQINIEPTAKMLSEYLALSVEPFSLKPILPAQFNLKVLEQKFLLTLGCALREEEYATAGN